MAGRRERFGETRRVTKYLRESEVSRIKVSVRKEGWNLCTF